MQIGGTLKGKKKSVFSNCLEPPEELLYSRCVAIQWTRLMYLQEVIRSQWINKTCWLWRLQHMFIIHLFLLNHTVILCDMTSYALPFGHMNSLIRKTKHSVSKKIRMCYVYIMSLMDFILADQN